MDLHQILLLFVLLSCSCLVAAPQITNKLILSTIATKKKTIDIAGTAGRWEQDGGTIQQLLKDPAMDMNSN